MTAFKKSPSNALGNPSQSLQTFNLLDYSARCCVFTFQSSFSEALLFCLLGNGPERT
jgi:hypothetical protein